MGQKSQNYFEIVFIEFRNPGDYLINSLLPHSRPDVLLFENANKAIQVFKFI